MNSLRDVQVNIQHDTIWIIGVLEEEEKGKEPEKNVWRDHNQKIP